MLRNLLLMGILSTLFGCGDGKPGLFSATGYHVGKDKVWYKTALGMSFNVTEVLGADPRTFAERELSSKVFPGTTAFYGMDKNSVFWGGTKIEGADLTRFEYLCNDYSRDQHAVYFMYNRLTEDVAHFAVVSRDFVKDAQHVYFGRTILSDDPAHFAP
ncbi:MAG: DKNYY domain-containing protein, partial [Saprospiraceae bacterium]